MARANDRVLAVLLATISTVGGCGRVVLQRVGDDGGSSGQHDAAALDRSGPSCEYDADTSAADAAQSMKTIFVGGGGPFNEPKNDGYVDDIRPAWRIDCFLVSSSGHLTASVTARFAGNAPAADDHRDALFWGVVGSYPPGDPMLQGELVKPLSEIVGVVASSPPGADLPQFAVSGSFDLSVQGETGSLPLGAIRIGLTWVRVYRQGDVLEYHVLPGGHEIEHLPPLRFDQPVTSFGGSFLYYAPLTDDPSLGSSFDYPSWIRAHVTW